MRNTIYISLYLLIIVILDTARLNGQIKPVIPQTAFTNWPSSEKAGISNDGNSYYFIQKDNDSSIYLHVYAGWKGINMLFKQGENASVSFSEDSRYVIFFLKNDTLAIINLQSMKLVKIADVNSYKIPEVKSQWLVFHKKNNSELNLFNLNSNQAIAFSNVKEYQFSGDGGLLLYKSESYGKNNNTSVNLYDLEKEKEIILWEGSKASGFKFDNQNSQLVFLAEDVKPGWLSLFYYKKGDEKAIKLIDNSNPEINAKYVISNSPLTFNKSGSKVFLYLVKNTGIEDYTDKNTSSINLWSYKDNYLQTEKNAKEPQYAQFFKQKLVVATKDLTGKSEHRLNILNSVGEILLPSNNIEEYTLTYLPLNHGTPNLLNGNPDNYKLFIVSTENGRRDSITSNGNFYGALISPGCRYVVWFDKDSMAYYTYEISQKIRRNISKTIPASLFDSICLLNGKRNAAFGIAAWAADDSSLYLYDKFDIWKVDPRATKAPINITNHYGWRKKIVFSLMRNQFGQNVEYFDPKKENIISAFDKETKNNGFFSLSSIPNKDPVSLIMGKYCYFIPRVGEIGTAEYPSGVKPMKAHYSNTFLVSRMNAQEFPNWFLTKDFKSFKQISFIYPERKYNWVSSELITWKLNDSLNCHGLLYKPENFDSSKKYPIIFSYYETRTDQLNEYLVPDYSRARLNIPYFVSQGYLVFIPDIYFCNPGHNGESVLKSILAARTQIMKYKFVDSLKMGLQGHSFGGWATNYIITHCNYFAAACEASGVSDQVSAYNELDGWGTSRQRFYEESCQGSAYGVGVTPWNNPERYISNSPVFKVGQVKTPLLMMHGVVDKAVPFGQALEMFLALKRANKKVWLLQYDRSGHVLYNVNDAQDYTIRMNQFFDHYLKGILPPKWMVEGL